MDKEKQGTKEGLNEAEATNHESRIGSSFTRGKAKISEMRDRIWSRGVVT